MQDKKLTIKRIAIYTVLAYLPLYVWGALCIEGEGENLEILSVTYGFMTMMFPTIALYTDACTLTKPPKRPAPTGGIWLQQTNGIS